MAKGCISFSVDSQHVGVSFPCCDASSLSADRKGIEQLLSRVPRGTKWDASDWIDVGYVLILAHMQIHHPDFTDRQIHDYTIDLIDEDTFLNGKRTERGRG